MGKRKSGRHPLGTKIRVKAGVNSPDFPEISFAGWTGTLVEYSGKKAAPKLMIEWDKATLSEMPPAYLEQCEEKQLYHLMACLEQEHVEFLE